MDLNNKIIARHFEEIIKKIRTKEELIFFLDEINRVQKFIFKVEASTLSKKVEGKVSPELKELIERLEKEEIISKNQEQQSIFWKELAKKLQSLPEIKLEIAFFPNDDFLNKISQWFEKELSQKIILDIIYNPKIVAGAIIEYRGFFRDFSLAKKIDELMNSRINELKNN